MDEFARNCEMDIVDYACNASISGCIQGVPMKELTDLALNVTESAGATYADMRIVDQRENRIMVERRSLKLIDETESSGFCIRAIFNGAWGFAASSDFTRHGVEKTAKRAVDIAKASALVPKPDPVILADEKTHVETCVGICEEDPFEVPHSQKAEVLLSSCNTMLSVPGVVMAWGVLWFVRLHRIIATSNGSYVDTTNWFTNPILQAVAVVGNDSQERNYTGGAKQAGYEFIRELDFPGRAKQIAEEAVMKAKADDTPTGTMDLVLDPHHLALTIHESVGHPTESDRILGWEANMAGRSFVSPKDIGFLQYGNTRVNFTVDNTLEGGLGSWFYDDDCVKMMSFPVIREGILVNLTMTRETAPIIGFDRSNGCCRSQGYQHFPINRQANLYMEPGNDDSVTPDDLISGVDKGIYIEGRGSFSIDQMRNNFQFGGDMFWMIEGGRKTKPLKKVTYQAQTRAFWNSCAGIAGRKYWKPFGIWNCGKGEPTQRMMMTHGASYCHFKNISVGGARI